VELVGRRAMLKKLIRKAGPVLIFSEHMDAADGERSRCAFLFPTIDEASR